MTDQFMSQDGSRPLWRVVDVTDTYGPAAPGQTTRIKHVDYETRGGHTSYVEVAFTNGWQQRAIALMDEHAVELDTFASATSSQ